MAIALIVVSVLGVFMGLYGIAYFVNNMTAPDMDTSVRHVWVSAISYMAIVILYCLVLISGAFSMIRGGSYVWAVVTSYLALVPLFGPCYVLGIPIGIWALIVLRNPAVKAAFRKL